MCVTLVRLLNRWVHDMGDMVLTLWFIGKVVVGFTGQKYSSEREFSYVQ